MLTLRATDGTVKVNQKAFYRAFRIWEDMHEVQEAELSLTQIRLNRQGPFVTKAVVGAQLGLAGLRPSVTAPMVNTPDVPLALVLADAMHATKAVTKVIVSGLAPCFKAHRRQALSAATKEAWLDLVCQSGLMRRPLRRA